ncbi:hypothetical protein [Zooshikella harenae]|uniref:Peptidase M61 catalytic domain-containing protein n=1 Tax=Zooshikella harenae TaxID=2827238 RepID=A0ABS5Z655_9GAMM|nr:hypothetical protein [Zooshikella harenae]MBU2709535.1 hypothetical protein [Zooshikella harenae]
MIYKVFSLSILIYYLSLSSITHALTTKPNLIIPITVNAQIHSYSPLTNNTAINYTILIPQNETTLTFSTSMTGIEDNLEINVVEDPNYEHLTCQFTKIDNKGHSTCSIYIVKKGIYIVQIRPKYLIHTIKLTSNTEHLSVKTGYCYQETQTPKSDLSDLISQFHGTNWLSTLKSTYDRRWPSGAMLVRAQANDPYFSQFIDKTSFRKMAESLMVAIHEETHMYDLNSKRTDWEQNLTAFVNQYWQPKVPIHKGFPRKEILPLIEGNATKSWDDIYLRDSVQGNYLMQGVLSELNAGLMGLAGVGIVGEFVDGYGASNARDSATAYMYHLQLYLRHAKTNHPSYYNKINNEKLFKDFVLIQWLRMHYYLEFTKKFSKLDTNSSAITKLLYHPHNIEAIENITGHSLLLGNNKNCLPENDPFEPPF